MMKFTKDQFREMAQSTLKKAGQEYYDSILQRQIIWMTSAASILEQMLDRLATQAANPVPPEGTMLKVMDLAIGKADDRGRYDHGEYDLRDVDLERYKSGEFKCTDMHFLDGIALIVESYCRHAGLEPHICEGVDSAELHVSWPLPVAPPARPWENSPPATRVRSSGMPPSDHLSHNEQ